MYSFSRVRRVLSFLLFTLLFALSVSAKSESITETEYEWQPRHDAELAGTGQDAATETVDSKSLEGPASSILAAASILPTKTSSMDHQHHRHGTGPEALRARGVSANSSTPTTTNPEALACYTSYSKWRQGSFSWALTAVDATSWSTIVTTSTLIQTIQTVATIYPSGSLSTYKLCDGSPRVDFEPLTLTSSYTSTSEYEAYVTPGLPTYSVQQPCKASSDQCEYLFYNSGLSWDDLTLMGLCGYPAHLGQPCLIMGGPVELAYFPVTTAGNDKCRVNGSTITNTGGPTTISALGTTLTSGSVYLSFKTLYAFVEGFGRKIGPQFTDFILPLPSSAVSTQCGGWFSAQGPGTPLNYADLNFPWPASAYNCMNRCSTGLSWTQSNGSDVRWTPPPQCSTIWSDLNPILAMPTEVRNMVPAWASCSMWDAALPNFVFDPPRALVEATAPASPTVIFGDQTTSTPASPAATSYTALPETMPSTSTAPTTTPKPISSASSATPTWNPSIAAPPTRGIGYTGISIEFSVDGRTFTASAGNNAFPISGQTISVGGPAQVVDGETISLALSGFVVNATTTIPFTSGHTGQSTTTTDGVSRASVQQSSSGAKKSKHSDGMRVVVSWAVICLGFLVAVVLL